MTEIKYLEFVSKLGLPTKVLADRVGTEDEYDISGLWEPVTDRTEADLAIGNRRGCFDWYVVSRIYANLDYIVHHLRNQGYDLGIICLNCLFDRSDYIRAEDYQYLCTEYAKINSFLVDTDLQPVWHEAGEALLLEDVNILERYPGAVIDQVNRSQVIDTCGIAVCVA